MTRTIEDAHRSQARALLRHRPIRKRFRSQRSNAQALYRRLVLGPRG